ncbi:MAG: hypothetical protein ACTSUE_15285 [Promethearchaeota archaeon]
MAAPCTFKMGPVTNCTCPSNFYRFIAALIVWLPAIPPFLFAWIYLGLTFRWNPLGWQFMGVAIGFLNTVHPWGAVILWLAFPIALLASYYLYVLCSIHVAKFFLFFENKHHPPSQGIFPRNMENDEYRHWNARRYMKKFPCWLVKLTPFPWMRRSYIYNQLGARIGKNVGLMDAWIDIEFVTIEDDVAIGRQCAITSHYFTPEYLILKEVVIKSGALIGERTRISPGTIVGEKATILAKSVTKIEQTIPAKSTFTGNPAEAYKSR